MKKEHKLIGNLLADDNDSDEEFFSRYQTTKRHILLNKDELSQLTEHRSTSAPIIQPPDIFSSPLWYNNPANHNVNIIPMGASSYQMPEPPGFSKRGDNLRFNQNAPEFVPDYSFFSDTVSKTSSEISQYKGTLIVMCKDQSGSRYLQQKIPEISHEDIQIIISEIVVEAKTLSMDVFGNYVIQKLLEFGNLSQKRALINQLIGNMFELSMHMYGCRVVQKAIELGEIEQKWILVRELRGQYVEYCVEDQNGNHVIQKIIQLMPWDYSSFIVDALRVQSVHWAAHQFGCRVIQRIIEQCPREHIQDIVAEIISNAADISKENYGNYVIQHLLDKGTPQDKDQVMRSLNGRLCELSRHKFASNVIEKCIQSSDQSQLARFTDEIFYAPMFFEVMTDKFGNFVIQKALEVAQGSLQQRLIERIQEFSVSLRTYQYGRHILSALDRFKRR